MIIEDCDSAYDTTDASVIEQVLSKRYAGHNMFWLTHANTHPAISILVNGGLAQSATFPRGDTQDSCQLGRRPLIRLKQADCLWSALFAGSARSADAQRVYPRLRGEGAWYGIGAPHGPRESSMN